LSSELLVANLLRVAKEDLDGARLLGTANNRNAVYLCEQAAEKIIRAVLTTEGKHARIKHLLNEMVDLVPDESPLKPDLRSIEHLAAYATAYRYPTAAGRIKQTPPASDFRSTCKRSRRRCCEPHHSSASTSRSATRRPPTP
jgi:HEPN domain-containing protein